VSSSAKKGMRKKTFLVVRASKPARASNPAPASTRAYDDDAGSGRVRARNARRCSGVRRSPARRGGSRLAGSHRDVLDVAFFVPIVVDGDDDDRALGGGGGGGGGGRRGEGTPPAWLSLSRFRLGWPPAPTESDQNGRMVTGIIMSAVKVSKDRRHS